MINLQIASPQMSQKIAKSFLFTRFFIMYKFELEHYMQYLYVEEVCIFADLRKFKVCKSQRDWPTNLTNYTSPQICGFAKLICAPPTFGNEKVGQLLRLRINFCGAGPLLYSVHCLFIET
jgi:hypothetical protein